MAKNRDYTGLVRTPSSMAWLILQRGRVKGKIDRLQKILEQAPAQLTQHQDELRALDAVIPLHEVVVDPATIAGKPPRATALIPGGNMTRHILNYLRAQERPARTDEIALHVAKIEKINPQQVSGTSWNRRVEYRLKNLVAAGVVNRHHPAVTTRFGWWSLAALSDD